MYFIFGTCLAFHKTATRIDKAGTAVPILKMEKQRQQRLNDSLEIPRLGGMELGWKQGLWYYPFPFSLLRPVLKVKKKNSPWDTLYSPKTQSQQAQVHDDPAETEIQIRLKYESPLSEGSCQEDASPSSRVTHLAHWPLFPAKSVVLAHSPVHAPQPLTDLRRRWGESLVLGSVSPDWERV